MSSPRHHCPIFWLAVALCTLPQLACGDDDGQTECTPGEHQACECPGGSMGLQYCNAAGSWDDCVGCAPELCGNGTCDATETVASCPEDCDTCGNGTCDATETVASCPEDCDTCGNDHVDRGEACDGENLNGFRCQDVGFTGGSLTCDGTCQFDTSGCVNLPGCGDRVRDASEVCDGEDLDGATCADFGYSSGALACLGDCSGLITTGCHSSGTCGNGVAEGLEECDGPDLSGISGCSDLDSAFTGGSLGCTPGCTYDLSGCTGDLCEAYGLYGDGHYCDPCELYGGTHDPDCESCLHADDWCSSLVSPHLSGSLTSCEVAAGQQDPDCGTCGDGVWNPQTELCEGLYLPAGLTCAYFGYTDGSISCADNCTLDLSDCDVCGDGVLDGPEPCDGANLAGASCQALGFASGTLACASDCHSFDLSGCAGGCGNGVIEGAELCDGAALGGETCASQGLGSGTLGCSSTCDGYDTSGCSAELVLDTTQPYQWVEISTTGSPIYYFSNTGSEGPFPLGFTFRLYGTAFDQIYVNAAGNVTFLESHAYQNSCPLAGDTELPSHAIAVMWDAMMPDDFGDPAYLQSFPTCPVGPAEPCAVVQWQGFHHHAIMPPADVAGTFEVVLFQSGSVLMQYEDAGDRAGATATIGIKGPAGFGVELACDAADSLSDHMAVCFAKPGSPGCTP